MEKFIARVEEKTGKLILENCRITYRNFRGAQGKFNHEGDRNFNVYIDDPDLANQMVQDGWNVRLRLADKNDPDSEKSYLLKVNVSYKFRAPKVFMHSKGVATPLTEETVHLLDDADIIGCSMVINPSKYENPQTGKKGLSAYLDSLHVEIEPDPFASKYDQPTEDEQECKIY